MRPMRDPSLPGAVNIMIVDDNPANLKLLEDMLRQHGYEVRAFQESGWRWRRRFIRRPT